MECRETQTLLTAFHDGELPAADRARVEEHLRGCPECAERRADLARIDRAAGVPDPGPAYWDRFNTRVMERVAREADGPKVAVLRPKGGWMRHQLRYLLPAAAAAALVVMVVRFGGMNPGAPAPAVPRAVSEPAPSVAEGERSVRTGPRPDGRGSIEAGTGRVAAGSAGPALPAEKTDGGMVARPVPPPVKYTLAPTDAPPSPAMDRTPRGVWSERKKMAEGAGVMVDRQGPGKAKSAAGMRMANDLSTEAPSAASVGESRSKAGPSPLASVSPRPASPCDLAHTLAGLERFREAESAQRECLAGDLPPPYREKSIVFLAELLDRQARFAEADAVIAEVERLYPQSPQLELYRQRRSMVQKPPAAAPSPR